LFVWILIVILLHLIKHFTHLKLQTCLQNIISRTSNQLVNYKGTHNDAITPHEIVAGYERTDNTTDQFCTQLVIITTHGLCT